MSRYSYEWYDPAFEQKLRREGVQAFGVMATQDHNTGFLIFDQREGMSHHQAIAHCKSESVARKITEALNRGGE